MLRLRCFETLAQGELLCPYFQIHNRQLSIVIIVDIGVTRPLYGILARYIFNAVALNRLEVEKHAKGAVRAKNRDTSIALALDPPLIWFQVQWLRRRAPLGGMGQDLKILDNSSLGAP